MLGEVHQFSEWLCRCLIQPLDIEPPELVCGSFLPNFTVKLWFWSQTVRHRSLAKFKRQVLAWAKTLLIS